MGIVLRLQRPGPVAGGDVDGQQVAVPAPPDSVAGSRQDVRLEGGTAVLPDKITCGDIERVGMWKAASIATRDYKTVNNERIAVKLRRCAVLLRIIAPDLGPIVSVESNEIAGTRSEEHHIACDCGRCVDSAAGVICPQDRITFSGGNWCGAHCHHKTRNKGQQRTNVPTRLDFHIGFSTTKSLGAISRPHRGILL